MLTQPVQFGAVTLLELYQHKKKPIVLKDNTNGETLNASGWLSALSGGLTTLILSGGGTRDYQAVYAPGYSETDFIALSEQDDSELGKKESIDKLFSMFVINELDLIG